MNETQRSESEVLQDLKFLAQTDGFLHVIAYFCFRDNVTLMFDGNSIPNPIQKFSTNILIREEISLLIQLACTVTSSIAPPSHDEFYSLIEKSELLLQELHNSFYFNLNNADLLSNASDPRFNLFQIPEIAREAIFYDGESAYDFQYLSFSQLKYSPDSDWLFLNRGFTILEAVQIAFTVKEIQFQKLDNIFNTVQEGNQNIPLLEAFVITIEEIIEGSRINKNIVSRFLEAFTIGIHSNSIDAATDFKSISARPFLRISDDTYVLFQNYSLAQAIYESPFYWFIEDSNYKSIALSHRGDFVENFCNERLLKVFGDTNVYKNVEIRKGKAIVGEIDVLVVFADRAIVLQAKSKKLTIEARQGKYDKLVSDFNSAIQDSYNQALECSQFLYNSECEFFDSSNHKINFKGPFKEIYPICVVSDHYPSLTTQSRSLLKYKCTKTIHPPFVIDVFFLEVMTEFLSSPLRFLSYINRRVSYHNFLHTTKELTCLAFHLKNNLWFDDGGKPFKIILDEEFTTDLDAAFVKRNIEKDNTATPPGLLTKFTNTPYEKLITQIEYLKFAGMIDLGFLLLTLSEDTINQLNMGLFHISEKAKKDGKLHDLTVGFHQGETGITIHIVSDSTSTSKNWLIAHAESAKYRAKADHWFGVEITPTLRLLNVVESKAKWKFNSVLEASVQIYPKMQKTVNIKTFVKGSKVGRNELCLCGSRKKYKKCCGQ